MIQSAGFTTRLLVSVRHAAEAQIALAAGADLIDVKEPDRGSLGCPDAEVIDQVVRAVKKRVPVSIALGELGQCSWPLSRIPPGVCFAKTGMADWAKRGDWKDRWTQICGQLPHRVAPVAVVYADWRSCLAPPPEAILGQAVQVGCRGVLIDTFDKSQGGLLDRWRFRDLSTFAASVKRLGMLLVVGGSLGARTVRQVLPLCPDYVAVRGAVCRGGRRGPLDPERISAIRPLLSLWNSH